MNLHSRSRKRIHCFIHGCARWIGRNWARLSYARHVEPTWLEVNRIGIPITELPKALVGIKIAHLTDFHGGSHLPHGYLEEAVQQTMALQPDVIALTGDFIHGGYRHVRQVARVLSELEAPLGVYAVLGNHDFSVRASFGYRRHKGLHQAVTDALMTEGIQVLRNRAVDLQYRQSRLFVVGLDDLWSRECDPETALGGLCHRTPRIVLAHNPQTIHLLGEHRCDLMLSGHTHGGQIHWPGYGPVFIGKQARKLAAGLYRHARTHIYVNKGIGFGFRLRYRVRPEIALFQLEDEATSPIILSDRSDFLSSKPPVS